jgi:hypothetical protein
MNSWRIIREYFVKDTRSGSCGYFMELHKAAALFSKLITYGKVEEEAVTDFNNDAEVLESCMIRASLKELIP